MTKNTSFLWMLLLAIHCHAEPVGSSSNEALDEDFLFFLLQWELPEEMNQDQDNTSTEMIDSLIEKEASAKKDDTHEQ